MLRKSATCVAVVLFLCRDTRSRVYESAVEIFHHGEIDSLATETTEDIKAGLVLLIALFFLLTCCRAWRMK